MDNLIASPVYNPIVFFTALFVLLVILTVSVARLIERFGITLPNLAAHSPLARNSINVLLAIAWLYLTYVAFALTFSFGFIALFFRGEMLLYALSVILIYSSLTVLTFIWLRGGLISTSLMIIVIISTNTYVLISKPGWVCKPAAESGFSIAYGCLARAYEYPGNRGLRIDASKMRYWYERAAEAGDSDAAFLVALKTQDLEKRRKLLKQAAEDGHIKAAHRYSLVIREPKTSLKWLTYAAKHGQADALFDLGQRYYTGKGVGKNFTKTRKFWIEAAEAGSLRAMLKLSFGYAEANAVFNKDIVQSREWEVKSVKRKDELAHNWIKYEASMQEPPYDRNLFRNFEPIMSLIPLAGEQSEQLPDDHPVMLKKLAKIYLRDQSGDETLRGKAIEIYRKLARKRHLDIQYELANILLLQGDTPEHEQEEGRRWLVVAAERNHEQALRKLIDAYENGKFSFPVDLHKSRFYSERQLRLLAQNSNTSINRSKREFAYYRNQSIREKIDTNVRKQSIKELTAPAEAGDANAQFQLAHLLMINHKREESIRWREKAAENGHADAQYLEADRIMRSALQKKYADKALDYYRSASKQNHPGALAELGNIYRSGNRRMKIQKNLYAAKIYYQKALAQTRGDTVYKHTFGSPSITTFIPVKYVRKYLDELPDAIKRLDLEGLSPQQKETKIKDWYYKEIEMLEPGDKNADKLKLLNQQRDVLLKNPQKS